MPDDNPGRTPEMRYDDGVRRESLRIGGARVASGRSSEVFNPYTRALVGTVARASMAEVRRAIGIARAFRPRLTRYERYRICQQTAETLRSRAEERSEEHTSELQSQSNLVCRLL